MDITAAELIAEIEASPDGPGVGAFFDLDGTIVQGYTATTLYADRLRRGDVGPLEFAKTLVAAVDGSVLGGDPQIMGEVSFAGLKGRTVDEVAEFGQRVFTTKIAGTIRPEARDIVRAHLRKGHTIAVASSATRMQIEPVANDLGIPHVICTELEDEDGVLTGKTTTGMLWGENKAGGVRAFAKKHKVDLASSFAYGNGQEDIAFLATVGRPHPLNPHPVLRKAAELAHWPVVVLRDPASAGLRSYAGTLAAMGGINLGLGVGAAVGVLRRSRQEGMNAGVALASKLGFGLAGVGLNIQGEENLLAARPAVFIGNHQSSLDPLVAGALLERDFTAVAKAEAKRDPRMFLMNLILNPAFIDRGDNAKAVATLAQVTERIRSGTSLLIFPEGTRSSTQRLGRFKKGAFHMAMEAGVPIVPIVFRNTGDLMWRRSLVINPGTVDVVVLEPIPTDTWTKDTLDQHIAEVRQLFVDTLDNWPTKENA
ncbi:MAG: HAD-IB family hydrolase [Dermatophilaceae bacterium]